MVANHCLHLRKKQNLNISFVFASIVGVTSGILSGGITSALEGTPYPLNAMGGDMGNLAKWTESTVGKGYPPMYIYLNRLTQFVIGSPSLYSLKTLGIVTVSLAFPIGYICWRRICNPQNSAIITIIGGLLTLDLYKPYEGLTLLISIPFLLEIAGELQEKRGLRESFRKGFLKGLILGLIFLTYDAWLIMLVAAAPFYLIIIIKNRKKGALEYFFTLLATFGIIAVPLIISTFQANLKDNFIYIDALTNPTYFLNWMSGVSTIPALWPPYGEFAGLTTFTVVMLILTIPVFYASFRSFEIKILLAFLASAWIVRIFLAAMMARTGLVQLWPRTSILITFLVLVSVCFGVGSIWLEANVLKRLNISGQNAAQLQLATAITLALFCLFSTSSMIDKYLPRNDGTIAQLAFNAQSDRSLDGNCNFFIPNC